jgi:hypothetical protein
MAAPEADGNNIKNILQKSSKIHYKRAPNAFKTGLQKNDKITP